MTSLFTLLLAILMASAHCRPMTAASPAAFKKLAMAPAANARDTVVTPAPSSRPGWTAYSATASKQTQHDAVEPQADVTYEMPADLNQAAAYVVAKIVAEKTGDVDAAWQAAELAAEGSA